MKLSVAGLLLLFYVAILPQHASASTALYDTRITVTWDGTSHPGAWPGLGVSPHFSHIGGAVHRNTHSVWMPGGFATPGFERMAELGGVDLLATETQAAVGAGDALSAIELPIWTLAPNGSTDFQFTASEQFDLVSIGYMPFEATEHLCAGHAFTLIKRLYTKGVTAIK